MLSRSSTYNSIVNSGHYKSEFSIVADIDNNDGFITIGGTTITAENGLEGIDIDWGLFSDAAAIGCAQARQITVKLRLATGATVKNTTGGIGLFGRVTNTVNGTSSNWLHMGTFFISRRKKNGNIMELTCYDPTLKAQGDFFTAGAELGTWPRMMKTVAQDIATRIGCTLSIPASLPDYEMAAPVGLTMRDVLSSMAAAWGGNWTCRGKGEVTSGPALGLQPILTLVPLTAYGDGFGVDKRAKSITAIGDKVQFTGVRLFWSDSDCFEAGSGNNKLECYCEWATQAMADNLWNSFRGKSFKAFEATSAWMHPAVEPNDDTIIKGLWSKIITMKGALGPGCALDISFPGGEADEDEYPYEGPVTRTLQKKVSLGKPYYGATISREQGLTIKRSDGASEAVMNSDVFSMRAKNTAGQMIDCIYFDALAKLYRITGQVEIDGALVTQNMYADEGDIVALTVDHLMTSRRVSKYIIGDTTNDNHIDIHGNVAKWIVAAVKTSDGDPVVIQHKNRDGSPLYWTDNPATAQVVNGHYEKDGKRLTTTTTNTGWPVYVYDYSEAQTMQITFGEKHPVIIFGSGDGPGTGRLQQYDGGIELSYVDGQGNKSYMAMDALGRVFFRDSLKKVDLSQLDTNGHFTFNYGENGEFMDSYTLAETSTGYQLTKPGGEVLEIAT